MPEPGKFSGRDSIPIRLRKLRLVFLGQQARKLARRQSMRLVTFSRDIQRIIQVERLNPMKFLNRVFLVMLFLLPALWASPGRAQTKGQKAEDKAAASPKEDAREKNIQEYVNLMRADVRQQKAEIMGAVMLLSAADATKFWPIYSEYDAELTKLNNQRIQNIKEYARTYNQMTDAKADELIQNALAYQNQRSELLAKTYGRVKQAVGAVTAARFVQVEHQLLLLIDLQIASAFLWSGRVQKF